MLVSWRFFAAGFAIGLLGLWALTETVQRMPTKTNVNRVLFRDSVGTCFRMDPVPVACPTHNAQLSRVPVQ